jgi:hypothetical protein
MLLKPGDKVSFLNEKRDGIVKKILNNKMVLVEIEDGFDIPVMENDLVKVQPFDEISSSGKKQEEVVIDTRAEEEEERFPSRYEFFKADEKNKTKNGVYIAFIPEDPGDVLSSNFGIYLVNNYSCDVLYSYDLKDQDRYLCRDFDRADERSAVLLDVIDRSDIEKWKNIRFQFLFFKKDASTEKPPVVCEIQLKPVRFYKEDNYIFYPFLNEKCFMVSLTEKEKQPEIWAEEKWENNKTEKQPGIKIVGHINKMSRPEPFPGEHIIGNGIAEVDLHIEEITENYSGKENFELLNIQLDYFSRMLKSAIDNKFKQIIFIHGVGNGKLKQEIIKKLIADFPELRYQDASILKYGKGATEIFLRN